MIAPAILGVVCVAIAIAVVVIAELRDRARRRESVRAALERHEYSRIQRVKLPPRRGWEDEAKYARRPAMSNTRGAKGR